MKALVTGAGGFVGRHLVDHLRRCGDEVIEWDRGEGPDILATAAVRDQLCRCAPDAVYHLAGQADVGGSWARPVETFRLNAEGTLNVLAGCVAADVGRVLAISSADVYGPARDASPFTEQSPLRPVTPYAASKVAADYLALQHHLAHDLGVIRVRAFNHIGPGQTDRFVAAAIASRIARNELTDDDVVPIGNLSAQRDFTDVRDVVRAYRLLIEQGEAGEVYNVCSGQVVSVQHVADTLLRLAERPMRLFHDPSLQRPVDVPVLRGDPARLVDRTGWAPEIPLETSLGDLLDRCRHDLRGDTEIAESGTAER